MVSLRELVKKEEKFIYGHRLCAGCGAGIVARQVMLATETPVVVVCSTGCLEVASSIFPYTAWKVPFFHVAFENAASVCSGIVAAYNSLKRQGKIDKDVRFIAFGGDGGTYDIGLQALSGAMERGHRMLYICYNNEAYMNTGIQRSSATPRAAHTTTEPVGEVRYGKVMRRKNLTEILVAHEIPYVAQTAVGFWSDLITKVQKALNVDGPTFINVLQPCQLGWGYPQELTVEVGKLAVETCLWPIYEVENGKYKINYKPKEKKPVTEYFKLQQRFRHLLQPQYQQLINEIQKDVDLHWERLLSLEL